MSAPSPLPLPATIRAFWGGNSTPSTNYDQSIHGRDLTAVGSPSTPSTPTPPEGDQWLLGGSDPSNHWQMPVGAMPLSSGAFIGVVAFKMLYQNSGAPQETFLKFGNGGSHRLSFERVTGFLRTVYSINGGADLYSLEFVDNLVPGTQYDVRIESRLTGTTLIIDGRSVHNVNPVSLPSDSLRNIGALVDTNTSYQDAFMISDDPDEPFPVLQYPAPVTGLEARPT